MTPIRIKVVGLVLVFSGILADNAVAQCGAKADCNSGRVTERPVQYPTAIRVCNRKPENVWVSLAYQNGQRYYAEGWWTLNRNECKVIKRNLYGWVYAYAVSAQGEEIRPTGQRSSFCINRRKKYRRAMTGCSRSELESFGWLKRLDPLSGTVTWNIE